MSTDARDEAFAEWPSVAEVTLYTGRADDKREAIVAPGVKVRLNRAYPGKATFTVLIDETAAAK